MTSLFIAAFAQLVAALSISASQTMPTDPNRGRLEALVGDWTVDVTYILSGREQHGAAHVHAEWVLNRHFVRQEYTASMGNLVTTTLQFVGFDPVRKKFTILKMDSLDDAMLYADGEVSADGRTVTFVGERSDMMTRTTARLRQVLTFVDPGRFSLEWYLTANGVETKTVTMVHVRKSP